MANQHCNQTLTDQTITTTTEKVVATISPVFGYNNPTGQGLVVEGFANVTSGTATTALVLRIRRGTTITDTLVGEALTVSNTAASLSNVFIKMLDTTPSSSAQYVFTIQQTAATADGTVAAASITAEAATAYE